MGLSVRRMRQVMTEVSKTALTLAMSGPGVSGENAEFSSAPGRTMPCHRDMVDNVPGRPMDLPNGGMGIEVRAQRLARCSTPSCVVPGRQTARAAAAASALRVHHPSAKFCALLME